MVAYARLRHKIGFPSASEKKRLRERPNDSKRIADAGLSINTTLSIIHADILDTRDDINDVRAALDSHVRASDQWRAKTQAQLRELGKRGRKKP